MRRSFVTVIVTAGLAVLLGISLAAAQEKRSEQTQQASCKGNSVQPMGHQLFLNNCSPCHGANAQGDDGPTLRNLPLSEADIVNTIDGGIKGEMPAFKNKLKAADIQAIATYVHSLKDKKA